jgi:hypothetical protein
MTERYARFDRSANGSLIHSRDFAARPLAARFSEGRESSSSSSTSYCLIEDENEKEEEDLRARVERLLQRYAQFVKCHCKPAILLSLARIGFGPLKPSA